MLHVHRAHRTDILADGLADVLAVPPATDDPFAGELVAVPTRGVERWLAQRLSHRLGALPGVEAGVCANVAFPPPGRLVAGAVAAGVPGGDPATSDTDPWRVEALVWPLLEVIDAHADEEWCRPAGAYLGVGGGPAGDPRKRARRHALARQLARLFTSYASQRPAMVRAWAAGDDTDGAGASLPEDLVWEAELWRRLRGRLDMPSPAERLPAACEALRSHPARVDLPDRLSVFGPTRLTGDEVAVLHALAAHRDVHLWLPHPSAVLWARVEAALVASGGDPAGTGAVAGPLRRGEDPSAGAVGHPLAASLGRDSRELQVALSRAAAGPGAAPVRTIHHGDDAGEETREDLAPATLLARLQADLRADRPPDPGRYPPLDPADGSVQVHACYGAARQVEILREVLLGLLADDPTLEPRDVLVLCPDVEAFAPLVEATFGLAAVGDDTLSTGHPGHRLRVRLADRSLRRTNPLLDVAAALLALADSRLTATEVLDLVDLPVVRRRFGLVDADVERLRRWVGESGVRWGLDAAWREPWRLSHLPHNTWRAGLDRILAGVAMRDEGGRAIATAVPLDDVGEADIDLAGRLAELVDRLARALAALTGERPLRSWVDALVDGVDSLAAPRPGEGWQLAEARGGLERTVLDAGPRAGTVPLGLEDVRGVLAALLAGRPTRANFRTGDLTVCSMLPMRSVPHRVVALLGMDADAFGAVPALGDDVLARDPLVGERDRRSEARQLLLDAVLAARDHLVICHTGADDRTNEPVPPAVAVGEILDTLGRTSRAAAGSVREQVVSVSPLQPFDPRHFGVPAPPGHPRAGRTAVASFDATARAGAVALLTPGDPPAPFLSRPLPPADEVDVELADLVAFVEHPAKAFLRQRLEVSLSEADDELRDDVPAEPDGLQRWEVGDRLLRALLSGQPPERAQRVEWLRGTLPPGALGQRVVGEVAAEADALAGAARPWLTGAPRTVDVAVGVPGVALPDDPDGQDRDGGSDGEAEPDRMGGGVRLTGSVSRVEGDTVVRVEYSRLKAKHRLRAWVQVLALATAHPDRAWSAVTIGRPPPGPPAGTDGHAGPRVSRIAAPPPPEAARLLAGLVALRGSGLREPLPLAAETSAAYAAELLGPRGTPASARRAAHKQWSRRSREGTDIGEGAQPEHALVWAGASLADAGGAVDGEPTRFGALALRLWEPLLAHETLGQRGPE